MIKANIEIILGLSEFISSFHSNNSNEDTKYTYKYYQFLSQQKTADTLEASAVFYRTGGFNRPV